MWPAHVGRTDHNVRLGEEGGGGRRGRRAAGAGRGGGGGYAGRVRRAPRQRRSGLTMLLVNTSREPTAMTAKTA